MISQSEGAIALTDAQIPAPQFPSVCGQCQFFDLSRECCNIKVERLYAYDTVMTSYVPRTASATACDLYQEAVPF